MHSTTGVPNKVIMSSEHSEHKNVFYSDRVPVALFPDSLDLAAFMTPQDYNKSTSEKEQGSVYDN